MIGQATTPTAPVRESMARSGIVSLGGSVFAALAALALTAIISRGFGASGTGIFFQGVAIFTVLSQVLRLGTNSSIVRFVASDRARGGTGEAWRITVLSCIPVLGISVLVGLVLVLAADPLAHLLAAPEATDDLAAMLRLMAPFLVAGTLAAVLQTVVRMTSGVTVFTVLQNIATPLSRLALAVVAVIVAAGASGAFTGWMAVLPVWLLVTVLLLVRPLRSDRRARNAGASVPAGSPRTSARAFWSFSAPRAVGASLETALDWSDVLIVAALTSPAEAGIYAVVTRAVRAGQVFDRAMRIAVSPRISHLLAIGRTDDARALHTSVARLMILATWPFYLTLAIMGPAVLELFGAGFSAGALPMAVLAVAMMVQAASGMLQSVLLQGGRSSWQMYNKALVLAINVGLSLLLVPLVGILGAAISWVVSLAVDTTLAAWQVHRRMGVRLEPRALVGAAVTPLLIVGGGFGLVRLTAGADLTTLALGLVAIVGVYVAALWVLRTRLGIEPVVARITAGRSRAALRPGA